MTTASSRRPAPQGSVAVQFAKHAHIHCMQEGVDVGPVDAVNSQRVGADIGADLVVIGGGGGGLAAAAAALEAGVERIVVVEKKASAGGSARFAAGIFGAETRAQRKQCIDATRDELFRLHMQWTHWNVDARLVRDFINKSSDTLDWLEEKGIVLECIPRIHMNQLYPTIHQPDLHEGQAAFGHGGGRLITDALRRECKDAGVMFLVNTTGTGLKLGDDGRIAAVTATGPDGELDIITRTVVVATSSEDGPRLVREVGGATENEGERVVSGPGFSSSRGDPMKIVTTVGAMARQPYTIWVNARGARFIDENIADEQLSGNAMKRQPGRISYSLFDSQAKAIVQTSGTVKPGVMAYPGQKLEQLDVDLEKEVAGGVVRIAQTWDEIADWMGASREVLKAAIEEYNRCCDNGYDEHFLKDRRYLVPLRKPPFYAAKCGVAIGWPVGGIKTNHKLEVLNSEGDPVPGLYACGNDVGSWQWGTYDMELSAAALGFAVNSGRIAADTIAVYLRSSIRP